MHQNNIVNGIIIFILLCVVLKLCNCMNYRLQNGYNSNQFQNYDNTQQHACQSEEYHIPGNSNSNTIGVIYPPRLGPLHSIFGGESGCNSSHAVIYDNGVTFNGCNSCLPAAH